MKKGFHNITKLLVLLSGLWLPPGVVGSDTDDAWFDVEEDIDFSAVNEGELTFLDVPPAEPVHAHHNRITLGADSLRDGWGGLYQCHNHLDPVPSAEVVFNAGRVRHLKVDSSEAIGRAWVEGHSVQLEDVQRGARLCISAQSRVLVPEADGGFTVRNGPFMRRFLDGYYPMHVTLDILLPPGAWVLAEQSPGPQPGFEIIWTGGRIRVDTWFSGELRTAFRFVPAGNATE